MRPSWPVQPPTDMSGEPEIVTTSVALMAFHEANANGKYDTVIKKAAQFLKGLQFDDSTADEKDPRNRYSP